MMVVLNNYVETYKNTAHTSTAVTKDLLGEDAS